MTLALRPINVSAIELLSFLEMCLAPLGLPKGNV